MVLHMIKAQYVKDLLQKDQRGDGRGLEEYREIRVETNVFQNTEGSAIAHIGDTKVLAAVKVDLAAPFPDRQSEGVLMVGSEFSPISSPDFLPGPPGELSIELARVVDRGIRAAGSVDLSKLYVSPGVVLGVFIDIHILDHNGNLQDAAALAAAAALRSAIVPKIIPAAKEGERPKLDHENRTGKLPLGPDVVTCTFDKIDGKIVLDASLDEEYASTGRVTLGSSSNGLIVSAQKSRSAPFSVPELEHLIDLTMERGNDLRKHLR